MWYCESISTLDMVWGHVHAVEGVNLAGEWYRTQAEEGGAKALDGEVLQLWLGDKIRL